MADKEHLMEVARLACYFKAHRVLGVLLQTLKTEEIHVGNAELLYVAGKICMDADLEEAALAFLKR